MGALYYFAWLISRREDLIATTGIDVGWWIGVFFALYYLPDLFTVGLSRPWGRWPGMKCHMGNPNGRHN